MKLHEARSIEEIEAEIARLQQELADAEAAQAQVSAPDVEPVDVEPSQASEEPTVKPAAEPAVAPKKKKRKYPYSSVFKWAIEELDYDLPQGQYVKSSKVKQGGSWFCYEVEHSVKQWNGDFKRTPIYEVFVHFDLDTEKWSYSICRPEKLYGLYRPVGSDIKGQGVLELLRSLDRNGVLGESSKAYFATSKKFRLRDFKESYRITESLSTIDGFTAYENLWEDFNVSGSANIKKIHDAFSSLPGWNEVSVQEEDGQLVIKYVMDEGTYVWIGDYDAEYEHYVPEVDAVVKDGRRLGVHIEMVASDDSAYDLAVYLSNSN